MRFTCCPPAVAILNCKAGVLRESFLTRARVSQARLNRRCAPVSRRSQYKPVSGECDSQSLVAELISKTYRLTQPTRICSIKNSLKPRSFRVTQLLAAQIFNRETGSIRSSLLVLLAKDHCCPREPRRKKCPVFMSGILEVTHHLVRHFHIGFVQNRAADGTTDVL